MSEISILDVKFEDLDIKLDDVNLLDKNNEPTMNVMAVPNPNAYVISQSKLEKDVAIKAVKDFVEYLKEKCRTDPIYEPTFGVTFGSEVIITEKKVDEALKEFEEKW